MGGRRDRGQRADHEHVGENGRGEPLEKYEKIRADLGPGVVLTSGIRGMIKQYHLFLMKAMETGGGSSTSPWRSACASSVVVNQRSSSSSTCCSAIWSAWLSTAACCSCSSCSAISSPRPDSSAGTISSTRKVAPSNRESPQRSIRVSWASSTTTGAPPWGASSR